MLSLMMSWKSKKREMERRKRSRSTIEIYDSMFNCMVSASFSCAQGAAAAPKKRNHILVNVTSLRTRNHKVQIPARERAFGQ